MNTRASTITIAAIVVSVLSFLSACHHATRHNQGGDSTVVKTIEELQDKGTTLRNRSDFEGAIAAHDSCITLATAIDDTTQLIVALNNQGTNQRRLGDMAKAAEYHSNALTLCSQYSDKSSFRAQKNRLHALNGLGNIYLTIGDRDAAEKVFREALRGEEVLQSATGQAINLANIGSIKQSTGQADSALVYYRLSLDKNREAGNIIGISLCYSHLGEMAENAGDNKTATEQFRKAYATGITTGDTWHWLTPCLSLAKSFLNSNLTDSAAHYISIAVEAAEAIQSKEHLSEVYALRSAFYDKLGDHQRAFHDLQLSNTLSESLRSEQTRNSVQNKRVAYETSRREAEVNAAEANAKASRTIRNLIIAILATLLIAMLTIMIMYQRVVKMRSKAAAERDTFYRNITHQLRTPMTVVLGMIDQLRSHIPASDTEQLALADAAKRQGDNLLGLMKSLIAAAKENRLDTVDISDTNQHQHHEGRVVTATGNPDQTYTANILVAEDNDDVALLVCRMLQQEGYNVTHALDGMEALDMLANDVPDLIVTDIAMPRLDGLELIRRVRADSQLNHLPIIVVSARVEDRQRIEGINAGAEAYIGKPFSTEELTAVVRKTLEQRELLRRKYCDPQATDTPHDTLTGEERQLLDTIDQLIDQNMANGEVTSNFLAERLLVSMSTLNRRVRNLTNMSPTLYIRSRKMQNAKTLLAETDKPISEIEWNCGYNTPGHFSRVFRSQFGITPLEYRKQQKTK